MPPVAAGCAAAEAAAAALALCRASSRRASAIRVDAPGKPLRTAATPSASRRALRHSPRRAASLASASLALSSRPFSALRETSAASGEAGRSASSADAHVSAFPHFCARSASFAIVVRPWASVCSAFCAAESLRRTFCRSASETETSASVNPAASRSSSAAAARSRARVTASARAPSVNALAGLQTDLVTGIVREKRGVAVRQQYQPGSGELGLSPHVVTLVERRHAPGVVQLRVAYHETDRAHGDEGDDHAEEHPPAPQFGGPGIVPLHVFRADPALRERRPFRFVSVRVRHRMHGPKCAPRPRLSGPWCSRWTSRYRSPTRRLPGTRRGSGRHPSP